MFNIVHAMSKFSWRPIDIFLLFPNNKLWYVMQIAS